MQSYRKTGVHGFRAQPYGLPRNDDLHGKRFLHKLSAESGRYVGYAGPAGRAAAEAISEFIIVDMYTKAVQGMPAEEAVKWAHGEIAKSYAA